MRGGDDVDACSWSAISEINLMCKNELYLPLAVLHGGAYGDSAMMLMLLMMMVVGVMDTIVHGDS